MRISLLVILVLGLNTGPLRCAPLCPPRIDWQTQRPQASYPGFNTFKPISGGGYFLAGVGYGNNPDQSINYGNGDFLLVRLDADFQKIWDQSFGGTNWDAPYLAQELRPGTAQPEDDEVIEIQLTPLKKAVAMVMNGTIQDAKTIAGVLWLQCQNQAGSRKP